MSDPHFVCILVEGPTERSVLSTLLMPHLLPYKIHINFESLDGAVSRDRVVKNTTRMIKQRPSATITTFFDYYGAQSRWVEMGLAQNQPAATLAVRVESGLRDWVNSCFNPGSARQRFIPYVQMYELEGLFFSQPDVLASAFTEPQKKSHIQAHRQLFKNCEEINNSPQTAPSKRIETIFGHYRKGAGQRSQARAFAERADLATIRAACPRFSAWVAMLEKLPNLPPLPPPE